MFLSVRGVAINNENLCLASIVLTLIPWKFVDLVTVHTGLNVKRLSVLVRTDLRLIIRMMSNERS
jgi:hypothetical protein